jgi:hypothetical protein
VESETDSVEACEPGDPPESPITNLRTQRNPVPPFISEPDQGWSRPSQSPEILLLDLAPKASRTLMKIDAMSTLRQNPSTSARGHPDKSFVSNSVQTWSRSSRSPEVQLLDQAPKATRTLTTSAAQATARPNPSSWATWGQSSSARQQLPEVAVHHQVSILFVSVSAEKFLA